MKRELRALRSGAGLTQQQLADKLGVTHISVSRWETGRSEPSSSAIAAISNYFNVSADYLLGKAKTDNSKNDVDLKDDPVVLSYGGKPVSDEDMDVIKAILARHNNN